MNESPNTFSFTVPGIPKGQGRPRFARVGGFVRTYDPKESRDWKSMVGSYALAAGVCQQTTPLHLRVEAYMPRPKRLCRRKDPQSRLFCESRPDADNVYKAVADALIGIAYADDARVVHAESRKWYHEVGGMPRTDIFISQPSHE